MFYCVADAFLQDPEESQLLVPTNLRRLTYQLEVDGDPCPMTLRLKILSHGADQVKFILHELEGSSQLVDGGLCRLMEFIGLRFDLWILGQAGEKFDTE